MCSDFLYKTKGNIAWCHREAGRPFEQEVKNLVSMKSNGILHEIETSDALTVRIWKTLFCICLSKTHLIFNIASNETLNTKIVYK